MVVAIIFGMLMGLAHFFSEEIFIRWEQKSTHLLSLSAGISIAYLFLELLPTFSARAAVTSEFLFLSILIGFVVFHIIEKYIFQHSSKNEVMENLQLEDSSISFVYHFILGMLIVDFLNRGLSDGLLFFIPILLYTAVSTLPVDVTHNHLIKVIVASSTLFGVLFAKLTFGMIGEVTTLAMLGFVIGVLCFTIIRHSIPTGKLGKPLFFVIGVAAYSVLIFLL